MPPRFRRLWRRRHHRETAPLHPTIGVAPALRHYDWGDPYHVGLALPWRGFLALAASYYLLVNLFFAALYGLQPGCVSNVRPGSLADAFFFSVQTFATVGYGAMSPQTTYGHVVAAIEIFVGLISIAVIAGLVFVRFSRPRSRLTFARNLVIGPADGQTALTARVVNRRYDPIYSVEARMVLITLHRNEPGEAGPGQPTWRIRDLRLLRERSLVEMMTWNLVHLIDQTSPLAGLDAADLAASGAQIMVSVTGTEGITSAPVHGTHVFHATDVLFGYAFRDLIGPDEAGHPKMDFRRIDEVVRLQAPTAAPDRRDE